MHSQSFTNTKAHEKMCHKYNSKLHQIVHSPALNVRLHYNIRYVTIQIYICCHFLLCSGVFHFNLLLLCYFFFLHWVENFLRLIWIVIQFWSIEIDLMSIVCMSASVSALLHCCCCYYCVEQSQDEMYSMNEIRNKMVGKMKEKLSTFFPRRNLPTIFLLFV